MNHPMNYLKWLGSVLVVVCAHWNRVRGLTVFNTSQITDRVNYYRLLHGVGKVSHSGKVAQVMQAWTNELARQSIFQHSSSKYGENLALASMRRCNATQAQNVTSFVLTAVDLWYNEESFYNYSKSVYSSKTGHFTQLVWKKTTYIGVGASINLKDCKIYIGMSFDPIGNYNQLMKKNVLPKTVNVLS